MSRILLVLALAFTTGCAERAPDPGVAAEPTAALTGADSAAALARGGEIATAVAQGLAQRLQAQLAAEGAPAAVDFCSRTALALTDSLVATQPAGTSVKRTSTKIRNPQNEPDSLERAALAWFDSTRAATGTLPQAHLQLAGANEIRFYRPLLVQPFCTQCHGKPEAIEPGVRQLLAERYPADRATGYEAGELRGLIRVTLPR